MDFQRTFVTSTEHPIREPIGARLYFPDVASGFPCLLDTIGPLKYGQGSHDIHSIKAILSVDAVGFQFSCIRVMIL